MDHPSELVHTVAFSGRICGLMLAAGAAVSAAGTPTQHVERLAFRTIRERDGVVQAESSLEMWEEGGRVCLVEEHAFSNGTRSVSRVEVDPDSLQPLAWERSHTNGSGTVVVALRLLDGRIETATTAGDGAPQRRSIPVPEAPYAIVPLIKLHLARAVETGIIPGLMRQVLVLPDGSMQVVESRVKDLGESTVEVPAGRYRCRHLRVGAASKLTAGLVPPADLYVAVDKPHPVVKTTARKNRFSTAMVNELVSQRSPAD